MSPASKNLLSFICILHLYGCAPVKDHPNREFKTLDVYFSKQMPSDEPGGAILIMKDDTVVYARGFGVADVRSKEPITPRTLFNLGSISKTFVANAILKLQEEGKLSVEDPLLKYFPGFTNTEIVRDVRLKHLLTHTSGLPDNRNVSADTVFFLTAKDEENWAPILKATALNFPPGSNFQYSNPAFNALALIVENVSGQKWQEYIAEKILKPSGMVRSTITDGPHPESGVAHAYIKVSGQWTEDDYGEEPTFAASGNGGVWSSVEELARYELALKNAVFLKAETVADSRTVKQFDNWSSEGEGFVGWSWFIRQHGGERIVGHTGDQGGFLCNYVTIPDKQIFFVILCNTRRDVDGFTTKVMETLGERNWLGDL
jgi:CubicO group peptidase (beta-lactamase class C family)